MNTKASSNTGSPGDLAILGACQRRPRGARLLASALAAASLLLIAGCSGSDDVNIQIDDKPPAKWDAGSWDEVRWQ